MTCRLRMRRDRIVNDNTTKTKVTNGSGDATRFFFGGGEGG